MEGGACLQKSCHRPQPEEHAAKRPGVRAQGNAAGTSGHGTAAQRTRQVVTPFCSGGMWRDHRPSGESPWAHSSRSSFSRPPLQRAGRESYREAGAPGPRGPFDVIIPVWVPWGRGRGEEGAGKLVAPHHILTRAPLTYSLHTGFVFCSDSFCSACVLCVAC